MFQHEAGHHAEAVQRKFANRMSQLATVHVTPLGKPGLKEFQRRQYEQEGAFMETRLPQSDLLHQPIAKPEFSHLASTADHHPE
jgi:hypothetical protein